jgi:hypothetical protein
MLVRFGRLLWSFSSSHAHTPHIVGLSIVAVWMAVAAPKGIVG